MEHRASSLARRKAASTVWLAAVVFVLALAARLWGLNAAGNVWDEYFYYDAMRDYARNIAHLDFTPDHWKSNLEHPPAGKYVYIPAIAWNHWRHVPDRDAYHAMRFISAMFGAATVLLVFLLGVEVFGVEVGGIAALTYGLLPPVLAYHKIAGLDSPMVFWWTLAMYLFYRWLQSRRSATLWLATIVAALAVCSKFNAVFIFPVFLTPIMIEQWPKLRTTGEATLPLPLLLFPFLCAAMLVALFPWLWSNTLDHFLAMLSHWGGTANDLFLGKVTEASAAYFLVYFVLGTPIGILALTALGSWQALRRRQMAEWVLLAWLIAPFLISFYHLRQGNLRYIFTVFPAVGLLVGIAVQALTKRWPRARFAIWGILAAYLASTVWLIHPYYISYYNGFVGGAKGVLSRNLFVLGSYGEGIKEATDFVNATAANGATVRYEVIPDDAPYLDRPRLVRLDQSGADYLIVNSNALADPKKRTAVNTTNYRLVYEVKAGGAPFVWVYQLTK